MNFLLNFRSLICYLVNFSRLSICTPFFCYPIQLLKYVVKKKKVMISITDADYGYHDFIYLIA